MLNCGRQSSSGPSRSPGGTRTAITERYPEHRSGLFTTVTATASATAPSMTRRDNSADIVGRIANPSARVPNVINLQC